MLLWGRREHFAVEKVYYAKYNYLVSLISGLSNPRRSFRRYDEANLQSYSGFNLDTAGRDVSNGCRIEAWDAQTGTIAAVDSTQNGGHLAVQLKLLPYETRVLVVR